jgi:hypothetical protein
LSQPIVSEQEQKMAPKKRKREGNSLVKQKEKDQKDQNDTQESTNKTEIKEIAKKSLKEMAKQPYTAIFRIDNGLRKASYEWEALFQLDGIIRDPDAWREENVDYDREEISVVEYHKLFHGPNSTESGCNRQFSIVRTNERDTIVVVYDDV